MKKFSKKNIFNNKKFNPKEDKFKKKNNITQK